MRPVMRKAITIPVEAALSPVENLLVRWEAPLNHSPMFIVGAPRTGGTLLYQLMARHFRVCYFSNLMMKFPAAVTAVGLALRPLRGCTPDADFSSHYGETPGLRSPNQGAPFWNLHIPVPPKNVVLQNMSQDMEMRLRNTIAHLQNSYAAPFLNKWPQNTLRLEFLYTVFPDALFIHLKRDTEAVVRSILEGRRALCGGESGWFSVKPAGYEELRAQRPIDQISWQLAQIENAIAHAKKTIGRERFITFDYEHLVASPRAVMDDIGGFYQQLGLGSRLAPRYEIPAHFPNRNKR